MTRPVPIIPTIIVAVAVGLMIYMGIYEMHRARWKEGLLAQYATAQKLPPIAWPTMPPPKDQLPLFRSATGMCLQPVGKRAIAGENKQGEPGYSQVVLCRTGVEGPGMAVEVGWSKNPNAPMNWRGGPVSGIIAPDSQMGMRLVAATAPPGLEPSAPPSIETIPNNHRSYVVQWFAFALIALVIYALALRKRWKSERRK